MRTWAVKRAQVGSGFHAFRKEKGLTPKNASPEWQRLTNEVAWYVVSIFWFGGNMGQSFWVTNHVSIQAGCRHLATFGDHRYKWQTTQQQTLLDCGVENQLLWGLRRKKCTVQRLWSRARAQTHVKGQIHTMMRCGLHRSRPVFRSLAQAHIHDRITIIERCHVTKCFCCRLPHHRQRLAP